MRWGVISDVHGNLPALEAAVADLQALGVRRWICLGDLVGYGPWPEECVRRVAGLEAVTVMGNHELVLSGRGDSLKGRASVRRSHAWTAAHVGADLRQELGKLPVRAEIGPMVLAHGSLSDPEAYVGTAPLARRELTRLRHEHPEADLLLVGNTHRQFLFDTRAGRRRVSHRRPVPLTPSAVTLLNPGSVGQSRQWEWPPRARAVALDTDRREVWFRVIPFDLRRALAEVRRQGLSYSVLHAPPVLPTHARRAAGSTRQRVRRAAATRRQRY